MNDTTTIILAVVAAITLYGMRREIGEWASDLIALAILLIGGTLAAVGVVALALFASFVDGVRDLFRRKQ